MIKIMIPIIKAKLIDEPKVKTKLKKIIKKVKKSSINTKNTIDSAPKVKKIVKKVKKTYISAIENIKE